METGKKVLKQTDLLCSCVIISAGPSFWQMSLLTRLHTQQRGGGKQGRVRRGGVHQCSSSPFTKERWAPRQQKGQRPPDVSVRVEVDIRRVLSSICGSARLQFSRQPRCYVKQTSQRFMSLKKNYRYLLLLNFVL